MNSKDEVQKTEAEARDSLRKGKFLYYERNYEDAVKELEGAAKQFLKIHLHEEAGESYFLLGESLRKTGSTTAFETAKKSAAAYKNSGESYYKTDAYKKSANSHMWAGAMFKEVAKNIGVENVGESPNSAEDGTDLWWEAHDSYFQSGLQYANAHMWEEAGNSYGLAGDIHKITELPDNLKSRQWRAMAHCYYKSGDYRVKAKEYKLAAASYEEAGNLYKREEDLENNKTSFDTVHIVWNSEKAERGERAGKSFLLSADNYQRVRKYEEAAKNYELSAVNYEVSQKWGEVWRNYKRSIVFKAKTGRQYSPPMLSKMEKAMENDSSTDKESLSVKRDVYIELRNAYSDVGMYNEAGDFFYKEKVSERRLSPSVLHKVFYWILEESCGYGEKPIRALECSLMIVLCFSMIFLFTGINTGTNNESIATICMNKPYNAIRYVWHSIYFSCITFTTLGYGDFHPTGFWSQFFAGAEAFLGVLMIAIFIFTFGRKMMR